MTDQNALIAPSPVTADQFALIKSTVAVGASDAELKLYLYDCARQGVHPLDRLIHFMKRGGKYTPVTSIDLMRMRAADTGEYAGSDDAVFETDGSGGASIPPVSARVTVWRLVQGQRCSFTATARWMEYCPGAGQDQMWRKMPHTMLAKCAEALALRKGFPRQLAGLYAKEEMDQAGPEQAPLMTSELPPRVVISDAEAKTLRQLAKTAGWEPDALRTHLGQKWGISTSKDIPKTAYRAICADVQAGPNRPPPLEPVQAADIFASSDESVS